MIHITMVGIQIVQFDGTKRTFQVKSHTDFGRYECGY